MQRDQSATQPCGWRSTDDDSSAAGSNGGSSLSRRVAGVVATSEGEEGPAGVSSPTCRRKYSPRCTTLLFVDESVSRELEHALERRLDRDEHKVRARGVRDERRDALRLQLGVDLVDRRVVDPDGDARRVEAVRDDKTLDAQLD
jgi:hypothetical protein